MVKIESYLFRKGVLLTLSFIGLLWFIQGIEWAIATNFFRFGILPRTPEGLVGIIAAPLIHGDSSHLLSNTLPLLILGVALFYFYDRVAVLVFILIYSFTGAWVWMAARSAYHVGASGLVYGLSAFIFISGLIRREKQTLVVSMIVFFLYGSLFLGFVPDNPEVSWESHIYGAIAGLFCAFYFRRSLVTSITPPEVNQQQVYAYTQISSTHEDLSYEYKLLEPTPAASNDLA